MVSLKKAQVWELINLTIMWKDMFAFGRLANVKKIVNPSGKIASSVQQRVSLLARQGHFVLQNVVE